MLAQRKTSTIYRLTRVAARLIIMHLLVSHLFSQNRTLPTRILKPDDPHDLLTMLVLVFVIICLWLRTTQAVCVSLMAKHNRTKQDRDLAVY